MSNGGGSSKGMLEQALVDDDNISKMAPSMAKVSVAK